MQTFLVGLNSLLGEKNLLTPSSLHKITQVPALILAELNVFGV
jgi:hypothetical protein